MLPYLDSGEHIPMYGVMMILGIAAAFLLLLFFEKSGRLKTDDKMYGAAFALIGGILGAKLLSILTSIDLIREYDISIVDVIKNGFVFYGGLIGGAGALALYCAIFKVSFLAFFDAAALVLPVAHAFGRVGCFLAGCCFGAHTDSFLGITYHVSADPNTPLGTPILPTQLFEAAYCLLIFAALAVLSRRKLRRGLLLAVYLLAYSVCRFTNEFFRADAARGFLGALSTSQFISIFLFLAGIALCVWIFYLAPKLRPSAPAPSVDSCNSSDNNDLAEK